MAASPRPGRSDLENRYPFVEVLWKLLPCDAVDHPTGVYDDDLKFAPTLIDYEKGVDRAQMGMDWPVSHNLKSRVT